MIVQDREQVIAWTEKQNGFEVKENMALVRVLSVGDK